MRIRHGDIWPWVEAWPIKLLKPPKTWVIRVRSVHQLAPLWCFWLLNGKRVTMGEAAIRKWGCREHIIEGLRRRGRSYRPIAVIWNGQVIDGNHTLLALMRRKAWDRKVLVLEGRGRRSRKRAGGKPSPRRGQRPGSTVAGSRSTRAR